MWRKAGVGIAAVLAIWASLAQIAPDLFQVQGRPVLMLLVNPTLVWVLLPCAVLILVGLWWRLDGRFERLERRFEEITASSLVVLSRTSDAVRCRLGDREIECEPAAVDYFHEQIEDAHRRRIESKIRRHPMKYKWTKRDFVIEVDEKARIRMTLDDFVGRGRELVSRIGSARIRLEDQLRERREIDLGDVLGKNPPGPMEALMKLPPDASIDLAALQSEADRWEEEVYGFLKEETHGHAEEFMSDRPTSGSLADQLLERVEVRMHSLLRIKDRIG